MITRIHGSVVFECDGCADTLETGRDDFTDALQEMKDAGWVSFKDHTDEWTHKCGECRRNPPLLRNL